jgi:hypothetical protein
VSLPGARFNHWKDKAGLGVPKLAQFLRDTYS